MKIKLLLLLTISAMLSSCEEAIDMTSRVDALPYYNNAIFTPNWLAKEDPILETFHQIPDFNLINQDSLVITQETFKNKIYVVNFFFTSCPGICPKMTNNMALVQQTFMLDTNVLLLSHSVTPSKDSVPVLKNYAQAKGVLSRKWHLVTGSRKEIYNLGRNAYFIEEDLGLEKVDDEFLHTENFVLIDQNKYIRGIYNGLNKTSINQLIADVKTLEL